MLNIYSVHHSSDLIVLMLKDTEINLQKFSQKNSHDYQ